MLLELAWRSLLNRRSSVLLTLLSLTVSVVLVIGVEHIRAQARESFTRTISGVDLVVGARTSQLNLLLYAIFRIGNASNGVSWDSYERITADPRVAWSIPLALGDSHRGFRVLGTTADYFVHYRYGNRSELALRNGRVFGAGLEAVLGSEVARSLNYKPGDELLLAHGLVSTSFSLHQDAPFVVSGILAPTGTPVDQTIHVSLQALEQMHAPPGSRGRPAGLADEAATESADAGLNGESGEAGHLHDGQLEPASITAFLVGLQSRAAVFGLQRDINDYRGEALSAILPGVALAELWQNIGGMEQLLSGISALVMLATLLGLATMLLSSLRERRREIALYRALGAHASSILLLVELESLLITALALVAGFTLSHLALRAGQGLLNAEYGLFISTLPLNSNIALFMLAILVAAALLALIPAVAAYRSSLAGSLRLGA